MLNCTESHTVLIAGSSLGECQVQEKRERERGKGRTIGVRPSDKHVAARIHLATDKR